MTLCGYSQLMGLWPRTGSDSVQHGNCDRLHALSQRLLRDPVGCLEGTRLAVHRNSARLVSAKCWCRLSFQIASCQTADDQNRKCINIFTERTFKFSRSKCEVILIIGVCILLCVILTVNNTLLWVNASCCVVTMNKYNNPSFAAMFQCVLLTT
jgi:hypothetical protein